MPAAVRSTQKVVELSRVKRLKLIMDRLRKVSERGNVTWGMRLAQEANELLAAGIDMLDVDQLFDSATIIEETTVKVDIPKKAPRTFRIGGLAGNGKPVIFTVETDFRTAKIVSLECR